METLVVGMVAAAFFWAGYFIGRDRFTTPTEPLVRDLRKGSDAQPGDVLIFHSPKNLNKLQASALLDNVERFISDADVRCLVLDSDFRLTVVSGGWASKEFEKKSKRNTHEPLPVAGDESSDSGKRAS